MPKLNRFNFMPSALGGRYIDDFTSRQTHSEIKDGSSFKFRVL